MQQAIQDRLNQIQTKLTEAQRKGLKCFGSESHGFRLSSPYSEKTLAGFESDHGITLPADYRSFLSRFGSGAGPYYGILPLERWGAVADPDTQEEMEGYLARGSVLNPKMTRDDDWEDRLGVTWEQRYQGAIAITHQGCTYYCLLVVSGPHKGRIAYVDLDGHPPFFTDDATFLDWYERWLDELIAGYDLTSFGFAMAGNEEALVGRVRQGEDAEVVRALHSLLRLPRLSELGESAALDSLGHRDPKARTAASSVLGKFNVKRGADALRRLSKDDDGEVRKAVFRALRDLGTEDQWQQTVAALSDPNPAVVESELFALDKAPEFPVAEVVSLLNHDDPKIKQTAAYALGQAKALEAMPALQNLLNDPDIYTRVQAVQAIRDLGDKSGVGILKEHRKQETDSLVLTNIERALESLPKPGRWWSWK